jgi:hypothetical protein
MTSIFILQETGYCRGEPRPFSTEEKAREALVWLKANEGNPGDSWAIEEHLLDFLAPVDHPNHSGKKLLPVSLIRVVLEERIPLNECSSCGIETRSLVCGACRYGEAAL